HNYDFSRKEVYNIERESLNWSSTEKQLNDEWRKLIKSQYLNLKLNDKDSAEIIKVLTKRFDQLKKSVKQYREDDVFQLFMNVVAECFDPHTNYFGPILSERFRQNLSLSLEGIGARLVTEDDFTTIYEVLPGGPAFKSKKLKPNDKILAVAQGENGEFEDVVGWRLDDVVELIKGPKGTVVRLKILPEEEGLSGITYELTLIREKIKIEDQAAIKEVFSIRKNGKDLKVGVIEIPGFYMDFEAYNKKDPNYNSTTRDVRKLIEELKSEGIDGLMIDLRNNGGGSLQEAIELTGLFIKRGPVVQVRNSINQIEIMQDEDETILWDGPLTVLINRFSASASEIFAGAIQDYNRGMIVGEQTYGKGTVQSVVGINQFMPAESIELGELKLTLQKFYRVTGSSTQHKGVTPDISLPSAFSAEEFGESSEPSALPWDKIGNTTFQIRSDISEGLKQEILNDYSRRLKNDPDLNKLVEEVNQLKESMSEKEVSLNEKERRELMELAKTKNDKANLPDKESIQKEGSQMPADQIKIDDGYKREGVIVLSEIILAKKG
ncbi:MAG: carboxy terminal-processing peptidase, partial [Cyclobacteriaceae bacterium]|nr:carboxy terminal-processing peptidase [Cyclobacteriaceae bacterium]